MKFKALHPSEHTFTFKSADEIVAFAQENNMRVHGHTLIWSKVNPPWVKEFKGDKTAWKNLLKNHIQTIVILNNKTALHKDLAAIRELVDYSNSFPTLLPTSNKTRDNYPHNLFKQALQQGRAQIGIWSSLPSPYVSELVAGAGYDWMLLDTEHAPTDIPQMLQQLQAAAAARPAGGAATAAVVRPAWNDPVMIKRFLDLGAQTLLIPFVQNAREAQAAVAATRYPPRGMRGMGGATRASHFGRDADYVLHAHEQTCVLVQVETSAALAEIEAIAAVEGVDGIFIGPSDLSASMGHPGNHKHPEVEAAIRDALVRIRACGKAPGILMADPERARAYLELGAQFVAVALDLVLLRQGLDTALAAFKPR